MKYPLTALATLLLTLPLGCAAAPQCPPTPVCGPAQATPARDPIADHAAVMQADRDFAAATDAKGIDGWVSYFAADGAQMADDKPLVMGKDAIVAHMGPLLSRPDRKLVWAPERAEVSGDLGYTFGHAQLFEIGQGGQRNVLARLKYLTVWRRLPSGEWRVVLDTGNAEP